MRCHKCSVELAATAERVFQILYTPSAIRDWWGASRAIVTPEAGGLWTAAWGADEDHPDYITSATLAVFDPPRRIRMTDFKYHAVTGPLPFKAEITTEFQITPYAGGCILTVVQDGFPCDPSADAFYEGCAEGWQKTFEGIKRYLAKESG